MNSLVRCFFSLLIGSCLLLAAVRCGAQDKKDPPKPADDDPFKLKKKDAKPADPPADKNPFKLKTKADDPDPFKLKKKDPKTEPADKVKLPPPEDFPFFVQSVEAKLLRINGELQNEFNIEVQLVDPEKVARFQEWQAKQMFSINSAKDPKEYFDRTVEYQRDLPKRQTDIYTPKQFDVRAAEKIKIRTIDPPVEYDDKGFLKEWTAKELAALKGNTKLPGYPATLEVLRANQMVQVYLVPPPPQVKAGPKKKKSEDDPPASKEMPAAVLIIVHPSAVLR